MANVKITDLTAYTDPASTDVIPIVDLVNDQTKKVALADIFQNFPDGTAAAPSIAFDGDSNTGIYSPGADQIAITTAGTGRLFISDDGKVGIGVSDPSSYNINADDLVIEDPNGFNTGISINITDNVGFSNIWFGDSDGEGRGFITYGHGASDYLVFYVGGSAALRIEDTGTVNFVGAGSVGVTQAVSFNGSAPVNSLVIDSSGKLGVGNSSPTTTLDVNGETTTSAVNYGGTDGDQGRLSPNGAVIIDKTTSASDVLVGRLNSVVKTSIRGDGSATFAGSVGIGGTTSPAFGAITGVGLEIEDTSAIPGLRIDGGASGGTLEIYADANEDGVIDNRDSGGDLVFKQQGSDTARIDSSGRLLVGTSTARSNLFNTTFAPSFQVEGTTGASRAASIICSSTANQPPLLVFGKSNASSIGGNALVSQISGQDTALGSINFQGNDGSSFVPAASISSFVDGTPGTNDMPGRLVFSTTPDGDNSPDEVMRITSNKYVRLASGTGGIQFNGDTAAANTLDDYEEGTWTPAYSFSSGSVTQTLTSGTYIKIGNIVLISFRIATSAISSPSGNVSITGLPFTHAGSKSGVTPGQLSSFASDLPIRIVNDGSFLALLKNASNSSAVYLQGSDLSGGNNANLIDCSLVYQTS